MQERGSLRGKPCSRSVAGLVCGFLYVGLELLIRGKLARTEDTVLATAAEELATVSKVLYRWRREHKRLQQAHLVDQLEEATRQKKNATVYQSAGHEVKRRVQRAMAAAEMLRGYWSSATENRPKRRIIYKKLDKAVGRWRRPLLRGKGAWWSEHKQGGRSLSYEEPRMYWRIPEIDDGLRTQRLRHRQSMVRDQQGPRQTNCRVFDKLHFEDEEKINEAGQLNDHADDWAKQYEKDLLMMNNVEKGEALLKQVAGDGRANFRKLLELIQVKLAREVPYELHRLQAPAQGAEQLDEQPEASDRSKWECTYGKDVSHPYTLQNDRWWCGSRFADRQGAITRAETSYINGVCDTDRSSWPYELTQMLETECPICAAPFGSEDEPGWHLQNHLPTPAPSFSFSLTECYAAQGRCTIGELGGGGATRREGSSRSGDGARPQKSGRAVWSGPFPLGQLGGGGGRVGG